MAWGRDWLLRAVTAAGFLTVAILSPGSGADFTPGEFTAFAVVGFLHVEVGLRMWNRRPDSRMGALMAVAGACWLVAGTARVVLGSPPVEVAVLSVCYDPVLLHCALVIPFGRLAGRADRRLAWSAYLYWPIVILTAASLAGPRGLLRSIAPLWLRTAMDGPGASAIVDLRTAGYPLVGAVIMVFLVVRYWRATATYRRAYAPFWAAMLIQALTKMLDSAEPGPLSAWPHIGLLIGSAAIPIGAAFSLARSQPQDSTVSRLIAEFGREEPSDPGELRDLLRRALADPTLEVARHDVAASTYINLVTGDPVKVPGERPTGATLLEHSGHTVGALLHDPALAATPEVLQAVQYMASLVLDNRRLYDEVRRQLGEVQDSRRRLVQAGDTERRRIERNIHDGVQQRLIAASLLLRRAQREGADQVPDLVTRGAAQLDIAVGELRQIVRGMCPPLLAQYGLAAAIESIADHSRVVVEIDDRFGVGRIPADVATSAYYVALEAIANAEKHAAADTVTVSLARETDQIVVIVRDDGIGGAAAVEGGGLLGLRDRVEACAGSLTVTSDPGTGTVVHARLPVRGA